MTTALIIIGAVILFLLVVLVHEFGHFITAKMFGVKVNEFAIGMGPKLFKKQGKETLYTIRLLPIGGFCAMEGEDESSTDDRAFCNKKPWQKFIIVAAGGIFNIILGLIFMLIVQAVNVPGSSNLIGTTEIWGFNEGVYSAAEASGLQAGDKVLAVNGYKVNCATDISYGMAFANSSNMTFTVLRDGEEMDIEIQMNTNQRVSPIMAETSYTDLFAQAMDISPSDVEFTDGKLRKNELPIQDFIIVGEEKNVGNVLTSTGTETVSMCRVVYMSLWKLITGDFKMTDMSGPVGIVDTIGQVAENSMSDGFTPWQNFVSVFISILRVMALITINLGLFNLLPVPALDGGRLVFIIIEMIIRKPVPAKYESIVHFVGLMLLFALMIFVTFNDIVRLIGCSG